MSTMAAVANAESNMNGRSLSLREAEKWFALATGAMLLAVGASRRSRVGAVLAISSVPLLYRAVTGHRMIGDDHGDTKEALRGPRGVHVRASMHLDVPVQEVYEFWRQFENLPLFMSHLERVTETSEVHSHWVARGPFGLRVEWDAEIINEVQNEVIGWRSLPGSDVVMAGSVNFDVADRGRGTDVSVHLQYSPPGGRAGALVAKILGREPSQTIRRDLRQLKELLEARSTPSPDLAPEDVIDIATAVASVPPAAPRRRSSRKRTPPPPTA